ncbi:MAG: hypothetical protein ABDH18_02695 [Aquificaceae bacterium]
MPREVAEEIRQNLKTIELSIYKIIKAIVDYRIQKIENPPDSTSGGAKKIEVE